MLGPRRFGEPSLCGPKLGKHVSQTSESQRVSSHFVISDITRAGRQRVPQVLLWRCDASPLERRVVGDLVSLCAVRFMGSPSWASLDGVPDARDSIQCPESKRDSERRLTDSPARIAGFEVGDLFAGRKRSSLRALEPAGRCTSSLEAMRQRLWMDTSPSQQLGPLMMTGSPIPCPRWARCGMGGIAIRICRHVARPWRNGGLCRDRTWLRIRSAERCSRRVGVGGRLGLAPCADGRMQLPSRRQPKAKITPLP